MNINNLKSELNKFISDMNTEHKPFPQNFHEYWITEFLRHITEYLKGCLINGSVTGTIAPPFSAYIGSVVNANVSIPDNIDPIINTLKSEFQRVYDSKTPDNISLANAISNAMISYLTAMALNTKVTVTGTGTNILTGDTLIIHGSGKVVFEYPTSAFFISELVSLFTNKMNVRYCLGNEIFVNTFSSLLDTFIRSSIVNISGTGVILGVVGTGTIS